MWGPGCSETKSSVLSCCFGTPLAQSTPGPGWGAYFSCSRMPVLVVTSPDFYPSLGGLADTCLRWSSCLLGGGKTGVSSRTGSLVTEELGPPLGLGKGGLS